MSARELITEHLDLWTGAVTHKNTAGRGRNGKIELTGIKKLRELILELAVCGKLVEQDPNDEPASVLLERIAAEKARLVKEGKIKKPKKLPALSESEKSYRLPTGWEWAHFQSTGHTRLGKMLDKSKNQGELKDYLRNTNVQWWRFDLSEIKQLRLEDHELCEYSVEAGDLLICEGGEPGRCAVWEDKEREIYIQKAIHRHRCLGGISSNFLKICLTVSASNGELSKLFTGATIKHLPGDKLAQHVCPLAPAEEQLRIVEKVDELMALCDRLEQQVGDQLEAHEVLVDTLLDALTRSADASEVADNWACISEHFDTLFTTEPSIDKLKQAILQLAVMGRLVEQDPDDEPASVLLERIAEKKAQLVKEGKIKKSRRLPEIKEDETRLSLSNGWVLTRLGEVFDVRDGTHDSPKYQSSGYPLITSKNLSSGELSFENVKIISKSDHQKIQERSRVSQGDILFAMIGSIGNPVIVNTDREFSIKNVALFKHYSNELSNPHFLKLFLEDAVAELKQQAAGGVQSFVSLGKLRNWLISLPPLAEQHRIVEKVDELIALCDQLKARLAEAGETRTHLAEAVVKQAVQ